MVSALGVAKETIGLVTGLSAARDVLYAIGYAVGSPVNVVKAPLNVAFGLGSGAVSLVLHCCQRSSAATLMGYSAKQIGSEFPKSIKNAFVYPLNAIYFAGKSVLEAGVTASIWYGIHKVLEAYYPDHHKLAKDFIEQKYNNHIAPLIDTTQKFVFSNWEFVKQHPYGIWLGDILYAFGNVNKVTIEATYQKYQASLLAFYQNPQIDLSKVKNIFERVYNFAVSEDKTLDLNLSERAVRYGFTSTPAYLNYLYDNCAVVGAGLVLSAYQMYKLNSAMTLINNLNQARRENNLGSIGFIKKAEIFTFELALAGITFINAVVPNSPYSPVFMLGATILGEFVHWRYVMSPLSKELADQIAVRDKRREIEDERTTIRDERDAARTARATAERERDTIKGERDTANNARTRAEGDRDAARIAQRDAETERDGIKKLNEGLIQERDKLGRANEALTKEKADLTSTIVSKDSAAHTYEEGERKAKEALQKTKEELLETLRQKDAQSKELAEVKGKFVAAEEAKARLDKDFAEYKGKWEKHVCSAGAPPAGPGALV